MDNQGPLSILLATDGSPEALRAAEWVDNQLDPDHHRIVVATVIMFPSITWTGMEGYTPIAGVYSEAYDDIEKSERSAAEEILKRTRAKLTRATQVDTITLMGPAANALVDYAKDHGIHLIVMGRRGHSVVGNLIGSVSFGVLQRSHVPVMIVPEPPSV